MFIDLDLQIQTVLYITHSTTVSIIFFFIICEVNRITNISQVKPTHPKILVNLYILCSWMRWRWYTLYNRSSLDISLSALFLSKVSHFSY